MYYDELSNREIARRLIKNFLKAHPDKKPIDFIKEKYDLDDIYSFEWASTPEGSDFWDGFFEFKCDCKNSKVYDFLKKYYFNYQKSIGGEFVNLEFFV